MHQTTKWLRDFAITMTCELDAPETLEVYKELAQEFGSAYWRELKHALEIPGKPCNRCEGHGDLFGETGLTKCPFCEGTGFKAETKEEDKNGN